MSFLSRAFFGALLLGSGVWLARSRRSELRDVAVQRLLEEPARDKRYAELAEELLAAGERVQRRLARKRFSEANARALRHIIGIERWGQRRLRVALGEAFVRDEHHAYKPALDASWDDLRRDFQETRANSVALARALSDSPPPVEWRMEHNAFGPLSARAWLRYLQLHADFESRRIQ